MSEQQKTRMTIGGVAGPATPLSDEDLPVQEVTEDQVSQGDTPLPQPVSLTAESLVEQYAPVEGLIEIPLPNGGVLKFATFEGSGQKDQFEKDKAKWVRQMLQKGNRNDAIKAAVEKRGSEPKVKDWEVAYEISKRCVDPIFSLADAIYLTRAYWIVDFIVQALEIKSIRSLNAAIEHEVNEALKELTEISTEQGMKPA